MKIKKIFNAATQEAAQEKIANITMPASFFASGLWLLLILSESFAPKSIHFSMFAAHYMSSFVVLVGTVTFFGSQRFRRWVYIVMSVGTLGHAVLMSIHIGTVIVLVWLGMAQEQIIQDEWFQPLLFLFSIIYSLLFVGLSVILLFHKKWLLSLGLFLIPAFRVGFFFPSLEYPLNSIAFLFPSYLTLLGWVIFLYAISQVICQVTVTKKS